MSRRQIALIFIIVVIQVTLLILKQYGWIDWQWVYVTLPLTVIGGGMLMFAFVYALMELLYIIFEG